MQLIRQLLHLTRINFILLRYNLDELVLTSHPFFLVRSLIYINPYYWLLKNKYTRAQRLRLAIEKLGPIYVKAGQLISTRRDIFPEDIIAELCKLQDKVPPFAGEKAVAIIEGIFKKKLDTLFQAFSTTPLAAASIAQVHAARLLSGEEVVVKVLRPRIQQFLERDINLLLLLAKIAEKYWPTAKHLKAVSLINEVAQTLYDEIDLMKEAANASQLKRNFKDSLNLIIPTIYWQYSNSAILVMERINGIPTYDIASLRAAQVDLNLLARRSIEIFFTQIFRDSFFHADLHPGNLFVSSIEPHNPRLIMVDFGIVGSLNHDDQRYIAENMLAFFKRDYQRVAELHIASGWVPPHTRIDQFESAIRAVSEPILEQPLAQISYGQLLFRLFQVASRFQINIQPQLILLQKTLLNIEGLCRSLAPELDLWATATPQIEKWLKKQIGFKSFMQRIRENLPYWSEELPEMPSLIYEILKESKVSKERERFYAATLPAAPHNGGLQRQKHKLLYFMLGASAAMLVYVLMQYLYLQAA